MHLLVKKLNLDIFTDASQVKISAKFLLLISFWDREITLYSQAGFFRKSIPPSESGRAMESHYLCTIKRKRRPGHHMLKVLIDVVVYCLDLRFWVVFKAFQASKNQ